jgi:hypothetical protein
MAPDDICLWGVAAAAANKMIRVVSVTLSSMDATVGETVEVNFHLLTHLF